MDNFRKRFLDPLKCSYVTVEFSELKGAARIKQLFNNMNVTIVPNKGNHKKYCISILQDLTHGEVKKIFDDMCKRKEIYATLRFYDEGKNDKCDEVLVVGDKNAYMAELNSVIEVLNTKIEIFIDPIDHSFGKDKYGKVKLILPEN
jgi:hypothetical protein